MIAFTIPGAPVGKGRTRSLPLMRNGRPIIGAGGRPIVSNYTPEKTVTYEGKVALAGQQAMAGLPLLECALAMTVCIDMQVPQSWSGKQQRMALAGEKLPTIKPDCSNVVKAIEDGLNGVVYRDDVQIVDMRISKRYAATPCVRVAIWPIEAQLADKQPELPAMPKVVQQSLIAPVPVAQAEDDDPFSRPAKQLRSAAMT